MATANDRQLGGTHYKDRPIQPWDFIVQNDLGFLEGNVIKYVTRWKHKNGLEDLKKAQHYLEKLIEVNTPTPEGNLEPWPKGFPIVTADDIKAATITTYPFPTGVVPNRKVVT